MTVTCANMPDSVTVSGNTYSTTDDPHNSSTYCYRRSGMSLSAATHFTVTDTDSGTAQFRYFHVSIPYGSNGAFIRGYYRERTFLRATLASQNASLNTSAQADMDGLAAAFWNAINV